MAASGDAPEPIVAASQAVTVLMAVCRDAERIPGAWSARREASSAPRDLGAQDFDDGHPDIAQAVEGTAT